MTVKPQTFDFGALVNAIREVDANLSAQAGRAVNVSLTLRNWLIGGHIEEYERQGIDRAAYGDRLMDELAETLQGHGLSRCDRRELYRYRQFYLTYPQIVEAVTPQSVPGLERLTVGLASSATTRRSSVLCARTPDLYELMRHGRL